MTATGAEERTSSRPRPARSVLGAVAFTVVVLAALAVTKPAWFGLSTVTGFLHLVSFPLVMACCWGGFALVLAAFAAFLRTRFSVLLVVVAVLVGAVNLVTVVGRGFGEGLPAPAAGTLTVVTLNTLGGTASPRQVAELVDDVEADAVALPETPAPLAGEIAAASAERGRPMRVFGGTQSTAWVGATSLLVARSMGGYRVAAQPDTGLGAVVVEPVDGEGPTIAAVHSPPPISDNAAWRTGADRAVDVCRKGTAVVVMGDVNATVDHAPVRNLGRCVDAAAETGDGAEGTWPAQLPTPLAAPIDHVLVDPSAWRPADTGTAVVGGSDHRALVARLRQA